MANLAFVGLGVMGGNMVERLLSKGHTVTGYNRTRGKAERLQPNLVPRPFIVESKPLPVMADLAQPATERDENIAR